MATVTIEYDDGSKIAFFDVSDRVVDDICDNHLSGFKCSVRV